jgi:hypothetical protein
MGFWRKPPTRTGRIRISRGSVSVSRARMSRSYGGGMVWVGRKSKKSKGLNTNSIYRTAR